MIFNENGFPRPSGATDFMDSCHIASMMTFVNLQINADLLGDYHVGNGLLVRCPEDVSGLCPANPNNFTRDQLIPYMGAVYERGYESLPQAVFLATRRRGYRAQNTEKDIPGSTKKFPDGADFLDPSHIGYMKICSGLKANWFEKAWMLARIKIASKFSPLKEPNNIIVMSIVYGYADVLRKSNPQINQAIRDYWSTWRGEPELAEMLIKKLEES